MKVLNIHKRTLHQPLDKIAALLATLSKEDDKVWPKENWPKMIFKNGIQIGAHGAHGPIAYSVEKYNPSEIIQFRFSKPKGFHGVHKFELKQVDEEHTEIKHTIDINTKGSGTLLWILGIRALHNALIEDGFDKFENHFSETKKRSPWNIWVKTLRFFLS